MSVRIAAEVSLVQVGEAGAESALLERIKQGDNQERSEILGQLSRLPGARLESFRKQIDAMAANDREPEYIRARARSLAGPRP
jgi:hypothetical protein